MDIVETTLAAENMSGVQALAATKALLQSLVHPTISTPCGACSRDGSASTTSRD